MKASVDANHDLLDEIKFAKSRNRKVSAILDDIKQIAGSAETRSFESPADYYSFYKAQFAKQAVKMADAIGAENALNQTIRPLERQWVKLRKE